ncbi:ribosomal 40S subunit protein S11A [Aspergillus wentii]|nr:ribosomal 40S subunit protein S11A [Aspergillus wentii]
MATELTVQSERAFQKQPHIFLNSKTKAKSKKAGQGRRWYKDVGLGFRTPKTAIEGNYIGRITTSCAYRFFSSPKPRTRTPRHHQRLHLGQAR